MGFVAGQRYDRLMPLRFVIHEHWARRHHYDLRLEHDGVLRSWAVPRGMPDRSDENRLAVEVDDHDLDHIDFVDPTQVEGQPAGTIRKSIWDHGTYQVVRATADKIVFDLDGDRLHGRFALIRTNETNWLLHLMTD